MPDAATRHLWEYDHPYYCAEGNYFKPGQHGLLGSWREFAETTTFFSGDRDQNLLVRWDWLSWRRHPDPDLLGTGPDELHLFFVLQRKALWCSVAITVTDDDEPAVRAFLAKCGKTMAAVWEPVALDRGTAVKLLEEALFLRINGERAPGGDENWPDWDRKTERYLRGLLPPDREDEGNAS